MDLFNSGLRVPGAWYLSPSTDSDHLKNLWSNTLFVVIICSIASMDTLSTKNKIKSNNSHLSLKSSNETDPKITVLYIVIHWEFVFSLYAIVFDNYTLSKSYIFFDVYIKWVVYPNKKESNLILIHVYLYKYFETAA